MTKTTVRTDILKDIEKRLNSEPACIGTVRKDKKTLIFGLTVGTYSTKNFVRISRSGMSVHTMASFEASEKKTDEIIRYFNEQNSILRQGKFFVIGELLVFQNHIVLLPGQKADMDEMMELILICPRMMAGASGDIRAIIEGTEEEENEYVIQED